MSKLKSFLDRLFQPYIAVFAPTVAVVRSKGYQARQAVMGAPKQPSTVKEQAIAIARARLREREGYSLKVYADPVKGEAYPTVGIGHLVTAADGLKLGDYITAERAEQFFRQDIEKAYSRSIAQAQELGKANNPQVIAALISANFQLGNFKSEFPNTFSQLRAGNVSTAVRNLYNSLWYRQTPVRVADLANSLQTHWNS